MNSIGMCVQTVQMLAFCFHVRSCEMSDTIRFVDNPLSTTRPGVGLNLVYLALEGIFFFILTLLLEVSSLVCYLNYKKVLTTSSPYLCFTYIRTYV